MKIHVQPPSLALRPWIRRFTFVEHLTACDDWHLPETGVLVAFRLSGTCVLAGRRVAPDVCVSGLGDELRRHAHSAGNAVAVVTFTPAGAAALFSCPLEEFSNCSVSIGEVSAARRDWAAEADRLRAAGSRAGQVCVLESLFGGLLRHRTPDALLVAATEWIDGAVGGRIDDLVKHIGLSQSALERRFRRRIGVTPKRFAMLARFRRAVRLRGSGLDLTAVAHAAGYADQAHFTHDCRRITGSAPSRFFAAA